jgi:NTP pyrophosphatase (non-canonical NTP hydrolase)
MKPDIPSEIREKIEAALLCLNDAANAIDVMDFDSASEELADCCDVLVSIVGDYDIKVTSKYQKIIDKAVEEAYDRS